MLAEFAEKPQYCDHNGECVLQMTQVSQTRRIKDKTQSHTALRKTEGSMIKHDLNISANSLHIKWPVFDASVSNFSSERGVSSSSRYVQKYLNLVFICQCLSR